MFQKKDKKIGPSDEGPMYHCFDEKDQ